MHHDQVRPAVEAAVDPLDRVRELGDQIRDRRDASVSVTALMPAVWVIPRWVPAAPSAAMIAASSFVGSPPPDPPPQPPGPPRARSPGGRHTAAALTIAADIHRKVLQTRLGHRRTSVTLDFYGHLMDGLDDTADTATERGLAVAVERQAEAVSARGG